MIKYAVYDSSGNILRRGTCRDADFKLQAKTGMGERVIEIPKDVEIDNEQFFEVIEGKIKRNPSKEAAVKAASAAVKKSADDRAIARDQRLQDIVDKKGSVDERLANLARILRGEV